MHLCISLKGLHLAKLENKKAPGLSTWGFFVRIWCTRRRLNWIVRFPYLLGLLSVSSVGHTRGHTRRFLLATAFVGLKAISLTKLKGVHKDMVSMIFKVGKGFKMKMNLPGCF